MHGIPHTNESQMIAKSFMMKDGEFKEDSGAEKSDCNMSFSLEFASTFSSYPIDPVENALLRTKLQVLQAIIRV